MVDWKSIWKPAKCNLMSWNEEIPNREDMAKLHSCKRVLWDMYCMTTYTWPNSYRKNQLHLECISRTIIKYEVIILPWSVLLSPGRGAVGSLESGGWLKASPVMTGVWVGCKTWGCWVYWSDFDVSCILFGLGTPPICPILWFSKLPASSFAWEDEILEWQTSGHCLHSCR